MFLARSQVVKPPISLTRIDDGASFVDGECEDEHDTDEVDEVDEEGYREEEEEQERMMMLFSSWRLELLSIWLRHE